jgi:hypothetical protein
MHSVVLDTIVYSAQPISGRSAQKTKPGFQSVRSSNVADATRLSKWRQLRPAQAKRIACIC